MLSSELFKVGDQVVYPAHGVGEIIGEEIQLVAGMELRVFIISLPKDKVTLRIPVKRAKHVGLRPLCTADKFIKVFNLLQMKSRTSKGMWGKRAQEYEIKINSGDIDSLAEVARDLHKNSDDPERSYSERIIYESALNRLAGEYAAVKGIELNTALTIFTESLEERAYAVA